MTNTKSNSSLDWRFLLLLSSSYFSGTIILQGLQSLMPFFQSDFNLSRAQVGLYSTAFFITATIAAIYSGQLVDKIGSKNGMLLSGLMMGIFVILHSLTSTFAVLLIFASFTGLGFSVISPALNKAVIDESPPDKVGLSMGIMQSGGGVGSFVGASLLPVFAVAYSWRLAVVLAGINSILILFLVKYKLPDDFGVNNYQAKEQGALLDKVKLLLANKSMLLVCLLGLILGTSSGTIPNHYTLYLTMDLNFTPPMAGLMLGVLQIGGLFGRIFWAWLSDKLHRNKRHLSFLYLIITISLLYIFYSYFIWRAAALTWIIFIFSFFLGTAAMGWMGLYFTVVGERSSAEMTGLATGLSLIFIRLGVLISPPIFGLIADQFDHYNYSWIALALFTFIGGMILYIQERKI